MDYGRPKTGSGNRQMSSEDSDGVRPFTGRSMAGGRPISGFGPSEEDFYGGRPKTGGRQALAPANPASRPMTHAGRFMAYENQDGGGSRPMTGASGRPMTRQSSARPLSGVSRLGTAVPPGTASRLMSASGQRGLATGMARPGTGVGLAAQVSVPDRPITQQGLGGLKSSAGGRGPGRQVQDKSFFVGELRGKMADLSSEIGKMSRELEALEQEQKSYLIYDVRVKELAVEWNSLQGEMADYNMLLDKLNTDTEKAEVEAEVGELKVKNDSEAQVVDRLFADRQEKERQIQDLELKIDQERNMADSLIGAMQPAVREQYASLQERNARLLSTFESMQQEVDALGTRKVNLEGELAMSKVKQDAVSLYQALSELEEQHANLLSEETQRGTPAQERERLFAQVKDDNAEIAVMERQSTEIQDALRNMEEEIEQLDMELEESQSERSQKYRELRKREETMDSFMATFDETWSAEQERLEQTEGAVVELLQRISRSLTHFGNLPSTSEFAAMQDDLDFKEGELTKSRTTVDGLGQEKLQLQANLEKIDALEEKVKTELEEIKEKKHKMEEEMAVFRDLDALREQSRSKELILFEDRRELESELNGIRETVQELEQEYKNLQSVLKGSETHLQLQNLERKWAAVEQANFTIRSFVNSKRAEGNFSQLREKVFSLLSEHNKALQELGGRGPPMG